MGATSSLPSNTSVASSLSRSDTLNSSDLNNRKSGRNFASTIKKRFSKKASRFSKRLDYGKILRDFLSTWSTDNLIQLVNDYETNSIIKEFYLQAELARPAVCNVAQDLRKLYDSADCADVYLEYKGRKFPVHKSIVCARCPLFRELLGKIYTFGTIVPIQIDIPEITTDLFSDLLRYLYSGEIRSYPTDEVTKLNYKNLFESLSKHCSSELELDLKHLLDTGIYSDVKLVFRNSTSSSNLNCSNSNKSANDGKCSASNLSTSNSTKNLTYNSTSSLNHCPSKSIKQSPNRSNSSSTRCSACSTQSEYSCHAAVLASRSRFFRNLILKYQKKNSLKSENQALNSSKQSIKIVLDEEYIKRRYINIVLNVIYCDGTNILNLLANSVCKCKTTAGSNSLSNLSSNLASNSASSQETSSFNNTQTIFQTISNTISSMESTTNKAKNFIDEIIDLFVIGKFLELEILTSICENLLVDAINLDTVCRLLDFSEKSNGSEFVRRQCLCFLREEFSNIATSQLLLRLNETQLIELIRSDFLQASEDEVLRAILKWTNSRLSNVNCQRKTTEHSTGEECRNEMNELIGRLIQNLRVAHILPLENDLLKSALKNEFNDLTTTLPPYMNGQTLTYERGIMAWVNLENRSNFLKPRFFQPFYEEAKSLLVERLSKSEEINFIDKISPTKRPSFSMPDNLYMVDEGLSNSMNKISFNQLNSSSNAIDLDLNADKTMIKSLKEKFLINKLQIDLDYVDKETKNSIRHKSTENYLRVLPTIRSLNLEEKYEILIYLQLKVLREHNLPDEMLYFFEQDEPDYEVREKVCLNMNLKRRSLNLNKNRKFSINSIDLENYLSYDSVSEERLPEENDVFNQAEILNQSDTFDRQEVQLSSNQEFKRTDLQNCDLTTSTTNQNDLLNQSAQLNESFNQAHLNESFNRAQLNESFNQFPQEQANESYQYNIFDESGVGLQEKEISLDVFI